MKLIGLFSLFALSLNAMAAEVVCTARGNNVGGNDGGAFVSDSRLVLNISSAQDALQVVVSGVVMVTSAYNELQTPEQLNAGNAYIGLFDTKRLTENKAYKPNKYKDYAQFKDVDAKETTGQESGMWGYLVFPKDYAAQEKFHAAYVFQAGDHMGGTLHFTCEK